MKFIIEQLIQRSDDDEAIKFMIEQFMRLYHDDIVMWLVEIMLLLPVRMLPSMPVILFYGLMDLLSQQTLQTLLS